MARAHKIGDYVHYRYKNYLKYGLEYPAGSKAPWSEGQAIGVFQKQHQAMIDKAKKIRKFNDRENVRQQLEYRLNFLFSSNDEAINKQFGNQTINGKTSTELLQDGIKAIISNYIGSISQTIGINLDNLNAWDNTHSNVDLTMLQKEDRENISNILKTKLASSNKKYSTFGAIRRRIDLLKSLRRNMDFQIGKNANFIKQLDSFFAKYESLIKESINTTAYQINNDEKNRIGWNKRYDLSGSTTTSDGKIYSNKTFADELSNLIENLRMSFVNNIIGDLGEIVPVISNYVLNNIIDGSLTNINTALAQLNTIPIQDILHDYKSNWTGQSERSNKILKKDNVITRKNNSTAANGMVTLAGETAKINYTQDKVDIIINLDNSGLNDDLKDIKASVKNVNFNGANERGISILTGTSIIARIQDYWDFTNHYLNVTANNSSNSTVPREFSGNSVLLNQAHQALKMTLAYHALVGGDWTQKRNGSITQMDEAQVFIVNDNSQKKGHYKVYFMDELINKNLSQNLNSVIVKINGQETAPNWTNEFIEAKKGVKNSTLAYARIAKILAEMQRAKLEVAMSPEILKNITK